MPRDALIAAAAGLASAVGYLSTEWSVLGALVLALLAPLPLLAAGFSGGLASAAIASGVAAATVAAVAGFGRAGLFLVADAVPALILVRFALFSRLVPVGGPVAGPDDRLDQRTEWYPPGLLLTWLTLYCAGAFVAFALAAGMGPDGLQEGIKAYLDAFREILAPANQGDAAGPALENMFATLAHVFPFVVVTWWIVVTVMNAVVAQKMVVRLGYARRPSPDLRTTELPAWLFPAVVAAAAGALLGSGWPGFVATNIALILCVPYFLAGLAVVHAISARWNGRMGILIALYLLLFLFGWPLIVVTGLGMVEHWAGLRRRFGGPGQGNERNE